MIVPSNKGYRNNKQQSHLRKTIFCNQGPKNVTLLYHDDITFLYLHNIIIVVILQKVKMLFNFIGYYWKIGVRSEWGNK